MRKSIIIVIMLLVLSLSGVIIAHGMVDESKDAVVLDETVLYGDKSAAEGLSVNIRVHCNNRLFWDTTYTAGKEPGIHTDFHFSQAEQNRQPGVPDRHGIWFNIQDNFGFSSGRGIDPDDFSHRSLTGGMEKIFKDVANRTAAGSTHTETVYVSEYYDFYPVTVELILPVYWKEWVDGNLSIQQAITDRSASINRKIASYFKIPVRDDHQVEVAITKNDDGLIADIRIRSVDDSGLDLRTASVVTENACYFTLGNRTWRGDIIDTSYMPGGYGIYCLPFTSEGEHRFVSGDDLRMVYALDEQIQVVNMAVDKDGNKLLLLTRESGVCWLTVLDAETAEELQKLQVIDCPEYVYIWNTFYHDDFLVVFTSQNRFSLIEVNPAGEYRHVFTSEIYEHGSGEYEIPLSYSAAMCWNGEKLAIAELQYSGNLGEKGCGFYLFVYDMSGPLYVGKYDSSLDVNSGIGYQYRCQPINSDPISVK